MGIWIATIKCWQQFHETANNFIEQSIGEWRKFEDKFKVSGCFYWIFMNTKIFIENRHKMGRNRFLVSNCLRVLLQTFLKHSSELSSHFLLTFHVDSSEIRFFNCSNSLTCYHKKNSQFFFSKRRQKW